MAFKATGFHDAVSYKIVHESAATNSDYQNVTTSPGTLYTIKAYNSNSNAAYLKFYNTANAVGGQSAPILVLRVSGQTTELYEIPGGLAFDNLSFTATLNKNPTDNTSPTATLDVKLVCS